MKNLFLRLATTLIVFFILTLPHLLYMITFEANIYTNEAGKYETNITAWGIPYSYNIMIVVAIVSGVLGAIIAHKISNKNGRS